MIEKVAKGPRDFQQVVQLVWQVEAAQGDHVSDGEEGSHSRSGLGRDRWLIENPRRLHHQYQGLYCYQDQVDGLEMQVDHCDE